MTGGQSVFLRAVADHIDTHGLPEVNISSDHGGGWALQLLELPHDAAGLVSWARSLLASDGSVLSVLALNEQTNITLPPVTIGGCPVSVWGCDEALREVMHLSPHDRVGITVGELAHFAQHGTLPGGELP